MLAAAALAARLILAAVFAVAAAAKLADRTGSRRAAVEFGVPEQAAAAAALVPIAELAVAGLLVPATTAPAGTVGSLALLLLFSAVITVSLARGRAPDCHCFGQLHSAPTTWRTLARNGVLVALAGVGAGGTFVGPDRSGVAWIGRLDAVELAAAIGGAAAAVLLAVGGLAFVSLLRSYGQVLVRLERVEQRLVDAGFELEVPDPAPETGLVPGSPAPAFEIADLTGAAVALDVLLESGLPLLLLFTSPRCGPCAALLPEAATWQRDHAGELAIAFVTDGSLAEALAEAAEFELGLVLVDPKGKLSEAFEAHGTPTAVLISADGTIGSWVASGRDGITTLVTGVLAAGGRAGFGGLPVGAEPPAVQLPSLAGDSIALAELRGRETLLLFWDPGCGFCRSMRDDLLAWERSSNGVDPRLVVVSSGDAENTREDGFRSLVLLDESFLAGSAFGANGTPMAVLLGADGRVASSLAEGTEAVFALAGRR